MAQRNPVLKAAEAVSVLTQLDELNTEYLHTLKMLGVTTGSAYVGYQVASYVALAFGGFLTFAAFGAAAWYARDNVFSWSKTWDAFYEKYDALERTFAGLNALNNPDITYDPVYLKVLDAILSFKDTKEIQTQWLASGKLRHADPSPEFLAIVRQYLPGFEPPQPQNKVLHEEKKAAPPQKIAAKKPAEQPVPAAAPVVSAPASTSRLPDFMNSAAAFLKVNLFRKWNTPVVDEKKVGELKAAAALVVKKFG